MSLWHADLCCQSGVSHVSCVLVGIQVHLKLTKADRSMLMNLV